MLMGEQATKQTGPKPSEAVVQKSHDRVIRELREATNKYANGFTDAKVGKDDASLLWQLYNAAKFLEKDSGLKMPPSLKTKEMEKVFEQARNMHEQERGAPGPNADLNINFRDWVGVQGEKYAEGLTKAFSGQSKERPELRTRTELEKAYSEL